MIYIPRELLHIILEYDGRIKYRKGMYINSIQKNDYRYDIITPLIYTKLKVMKNIRKISNTKYYFVVHFKGLPHTDLAFYYHWKRENEFEICYCESKDITYSYVFTSYICNNTGFQKITTFGLHL